MPSRLPSPTTPTWSPPRKPKATSQVENGDLTAPAPEAVEPDEVDIHGQGWIYLTHPEVGGPARYPVEVADDMYAQGWARPGDVEAPRLEDQTKADLQAQLKELGLPTSGTKQELIDRLAEYEDAPVEPDTEEQ